MCLARADVSLEKDGVVAERRRRFAAAPPRGAPAKSARVLDHAHAAAAAAERRLDDEREADSRGRLRGVRKLRDRLLGAGNDREPGLLRQIPGGGLVAEQLEQLRARSDERDARARTGARQRGILGEESVAGVNRVDALLSRQRDDAIHVEIGLDRTLAFADLVRLVGLETVQAEPVLLRVDGDGAQPELSGRAQDADGDLAAVQGKQFFHRKKFRLARNELRDLFVSSA